jgi:hypothetical protein
MLFLLASPVRSWYSQASNQIDLLEKQNLEMPHDANREMFLTTHFFYDKLHKSCKFVIKKERKMRTWEEIAKPTAHTSHSHGAQDKQA